MSINKQETDVTLWARLTVHVPPDKYPDKTPAEIAEIIQDHVARVMDTFVVSGMKKPLSDMDAVLLEVEVDGDAVHEPIKPYEWYHPKFGQEPPHPSTRQPS